jgi:hypothetical protein
MDNLPTSVPQLVRREVWPTPRSLPACVQISMLPFSGYGNNAYAATIDLGGQLGDYVGPTDQMGH